MTISQAVVLLRIINQRPTPFILVMFSNPALLLVALLLSLKLST